METKSSKNAPKSASNNKGMILLMSYTDSSFTELCRKYRGCYILDNRAKGWSSDMALRAETLKAAFGNRYQLIPSLGVSSGESPEDYLSKASAAIARILEVTDSGKSIIITGFSSGLLKCIGHILLSQEPSLKVYLKWEKDEQSGISRQRPMKDEDFSAKLAKICESLDTFKPGESEPDEEDFAGL